MTMPNFKTVTIKILKIDKLQETADGWTPRDIGRTLTGPLYEGDSWFEGRFDNSTERYDDGAMDLADLTEGIDYEFVTGDANDVL